MVVVIILLLFEDVNSLVCCMVSCEDLLVVVLKLIGLYCSLFMFSLCEVVCEVGIVLNSFYWQFCDMDELVVVLIDVVGCLLCIIIGEVCQCVIFIVISVVWVLVEIFMEQLCVDDKLLYVLLCEGVVGLDDFKYVVECELYYFEEELQYDLVCLVVLDGVVLYVLELVVKVIIWLVFVMGVIVMDLLLEKDLELVEQIFMMICMIIVGVCMFVVFCRG